MALSPEKMAGFVVDEMIDEVDKLAAQLEAFADRYARYGEQYRHLVTPEQHARLEAAFRRFVERFPSDD